MKDAAPKTIRLQDYQAPPYWIDQANLTFDLREQGTRVLAELQLRANQEYRGPMDQGLRLDGEGLQHLSLAIDGEALASERYSIDAEGLWLRDPPQQFTLSSEVVIEPEHNTALEGLYRSNTMFCTQCEAEGFRKITWFLDRPDVMARFKVRLEADERLFPVLLSNGNPGATGTLPEGRHFAEWDDPFPKPAYLFALVAGDLKHVQQDFVTHLGRKVDLRIYVEPENIDKCAHAMQSLVNAMRWDEQTYGREYDLEVFNIVAVSDFNMGAMENKGLNIFNSKYVLARPQTATDRDFQGIEGVIAHEYFHNWTGNRITCRDWFQLSLKEGLTVYRDQEFSADMGSRGVKRIEDVRMLRAHQFAEDASPMAHPVRPNSYIEINNFYTLTVYEKGAEVVRMQANLLGPESYRKATDLYFERHDGQAVTTEDFVACMAQASGRDLEQFKRWYDYAGTPVLTVSDSYDQQGQCYSLTVTQAVPDTPGQTDKPAFHIPFALGLLDAQGEDITLQCGGVASRNGTLMLELREPVQTFEFSGIPERPVPSLLRGFSAPVKVEYPYTEEQLRHLMSHDSDGFNRWDASQTLLRQILLEMVDQRAQGGPMAVPTGLIEALRNALLDAVDTEDALLAEVLTLPALGYLGDFMQVVDVEGLFEARETLRSEVAKALRDDMLALYERLSVTAEYTPDAASIGRRSLRNCVLGYLTSLGDESMIELAVSQYREQNNMTDVMAALSLLADIEHGSRDQVLQDFAERWAHDALVMDKWFAAQAVSTRSSVLDEVRVLMQHPAFSLRNPNKVRSLIGAFANANPLRFHAADGSGYNFLVDQVLALDTLNPQIAARLLRSMSRWRRYDEPRQQLMREALGRVTAAKVSKDVFEIASKSLES